MPYLPGKAVSVVPPVSFGKLVKREKELPNRNEIPRTEQKKKEKFTLLRAKQNAESREGEMVQMRSNRNFLESNLREILEVGLIAYR